MKNLWLISGSVTRWAAGKGYRCFKMSGKRNNGVMDKIESLIDRIDYKSVSIVIITRKKNTDA